MIKRYCLNIFKYCLDSEKLFKNNERIANAFIYS